MTDNLSCLFSVLCEENYKKNYCQQELNIGYVLYVLCGTKEKEEEEESIAKIKASCILSCNKLLTSLKGKLWQNRMNK